MNTEFGPQKRKNSLEKGSMADLLFESANIIDLAGYRTPEMAPNVRIAKAWLDDENSWWWLEALQDVESPLLKAPDGVPPTIYKLGRKTIGSQMHFIYRSDDPQIGILHEDGRTYSHLDRKIQPYRTSEILRGLGFFPKDQGLAERPYPEQWGRNRDHELSGVDQVRALFDEIVWDNYGEIPSRKNTSSKVKKNLFAGVRTWLGLDQGQL